MVLRTLIPATLGGFVESTSLGLLTGTALLATLATGLSPMTDTALAASTAAADAVASVPLIPRDAPVRQSDPRGRTREPRRPVAELARPARGRDERVDRSGERSSTAAKRMTSSTDRPIPQYFWAPDSKSVLYVQDKGGDENFLLYQVDVASGTERTLTPFENTRVGLVGGSVQHKDKLLIGVNNRDPRFHDVHLLDLGSGTLTLVQQNDGLRRVHGRRQPGAALGDPRQTPRAAWTCSRSPTAKSPRPRAKAPGSRTR